MRPASMSSPSSSSPSSQTLLALERTEAALGGTGGSRQLDAVDLDVAFETPALTGLRIPADSSIGAHVVDGDGVAHDVAIVDNGNRTPTSVRATHLELDKPRREQREFCSSTCLDGPFDTVPTTKEDLFVFETNLVDEAFSVVIDVWAGDDDVDDETAPRTVDSAPLPMGAGGWLAGRELNITPAADQERLTVRLRAIHDGAAGPQATAE